MLNFLGKGQNFVYAFCCIGAFYLLYAFFAKEIPDGQYVTDKVKVYDQSNEEYLYLNLVVDVEDNAYYIREIISPNTGKATETTYEGNAFGQKCTFSLADESRNVYGRFSTPTKYVVTLFADDIPITYMDRIQNDLFGFAIRAALLAFLIYATFQANKKGN